jgi:hypothetical protein
MIEAEAVRVRCARGGDRIRTWEQKAVANATAFLLCSVWRREKTRPMILFSIEISPCTEEGQRNGHRGPSSLLQTEDEWEKGRKSMGECEGGWESPFT